MEQQKIRAFVETFFRLRKCEILGSDRSSITVRLNPETDKDLGYRPFYWSYVESAGIKPELLEMTYKFEPDGAKGWKTEILSFGSPRLKAIIEAVKRDGRFIQLFERISPSSHIRSLDPWLIVNEKVEYRSDLKKERILSFGISLITGQIREAFYSALLKRPLSPSPPPLIYLKPLLISMDEAVHIIEGHIRQILDAEKGDWAEEAKKRLEEEKKEVEAYYGSHPSSNLLEEEKERRLKELTWKYEPRIEVTPINQGIFYLQSGPISSSLLSTPRMGSEFEG